MSVRAMSDHALYRELEQTCRMLYALEHEIRRRRALDAMRDAPA
jgi:hypothetical protein